MNLEDEVARVACLPLAHRCKELLGGDYTLDTVLAWTLELIRWAREQPAPAFNKDWPLQRVIQMSLPNRSSVTMWVVKWGEFRIVGVRRRHTMLVVGTI